MWVKFELSWDWQTTTKSLSRGLVSLSSLSPSWQRWRKHGNGKMNKNMFFKNLKPDWSWHWSWSDCVHEGCSNCTRMYIGTCWVLELWSPMWMMREESLYWHMLVISATILNLSSYEKECIIAIWVVVHFRCYLHGNPFTLVIDHQPLKWFMESNKLISKLAWWASIFISRKFIFYDCHLQLIFSCMWHIIHMMYI